MKEMSEFEILAYVVMSEKISGLFSDVRIFPPENVRIAPRAPGNPVLFTWFTFAEKGLPPKHM